MISSAKTHLKPVQNVVALNVNFHWDDINLIGGGGGFPPFQIWESYVGRGESAFISNLQ